MIDALHTVYVGVNESKREADDDKVVDDDDDDGVVMIMTIGVVNMMVKMVVVDPMLQLALFRVSLIYVQK